VTFNRRSGIYGRVEQMLVKWTDVQVTAAEKLAHIFYISSRPIVH